MEKLGASYRNKRGEEIVRAGYESKILDSASSFKNFCIAKALSESIQILWSLF